MAQHLPLVGYAATGFRTTPSRAIGILLLVAPALTLSCTDVRVSAVDVAMVEIEPGSLSLMVGDSARVSAKLLDAAGHELSGRTISWSSGTPAVATIDASGRVRALTPGSTVIAATSEGARAEIPIVISARPALVVDPVSVTLTASAGGLPPPATTVIVRANGTANGLTVHTSYTQGQPTGWLVASLTGTTTPAILTLNVSSAGLAPGTYDATVTVDAQDAESARVLPVTLVVQPMRPAIGLSMTAAAFAATQGGGDPSPQTIDVTNAGGGLLDGLRIAIAYAAGQPAGWLHASLNGTTAPATLTLEPSTGTLPAGSYSATVLISSNAATNSPQVLDVTFDVGSPPPRILALPSTVIMNGTAGADPAPVAAAITNGGGGQLTGLHTMVTHASGEPTGWLTASLSSTVAPATMTLSASTAALAVGSYSAIVQVAAADASIAPAALTVTLNVIVPVRAPAIGASPAAVVVSAVEGGANPAAAVIDITNTGGGTLDALSVAIMYDAGQPTGWLDVVLGGTTAPTRITAQATTGALLAGTYGATIEVSSPAAGNSPLAIDVTFTVTPPPAIAVSTTMAAFSDVVGGSNPPSQVIDVTNGGGGTLDGLSVAVNYGGGQGGWLDATLSTQTAPATITLQPVTGALSSGTYTAKVEVTSATATNSPVSIDITFTVMAAPAPPAISLGSGSLAFQATAGGADPATQQVDVLNGGGGTLDQLAVSVAYGAGQPAGWLSASIASPAAPTKITVQPGTGQLAPGTWDATITVASPVASNSPVSLDVTFTVDSPPALALTTGSLTFQGTTGGSNPQPQNIDITNGGGGTLDGLAANVRYDAGQPGGWLNLVLGGTTAPATLTVQAEVGSLAAGTYGATIDVTSAVASNSPQTIIVSFTLLSIPPPAAPVLLTVEEHKHHADITWQDNSSNETSFVVQRSLDATSGWSDLVTLNANTTSWRDDTATRGLVHYYRIAACNAAGCSISNVLSVLI